MFGLRITEVCPSNSHMRSQLSPDGNNMNSIVRFYSRQTWVFMLFYRSNMNIRECIVIYVLN